MLKCQTLEGEQVLGEEVKNSVVSSVSLSCLIDSWVEMSNRQLCLLDTQVEMSHWQPDGCEWVSWENGNWCCKSESYRRCFSPSDAAGSASSPLDMLIPLSEPFLTYPSFHWLPLVFQEFSSNVIFPWKKSSWILQARFNPSVIWSPNTS